MFKGATVGSNSNRRFILLVILKNSLNYHFDSFCTRATCGFLVYISLQIRSINNRVAVLFLAEKKKHCSATYIMHQANARKKERGNYERMWRERSSSFSEENRQQSARFRCESSCQSKYWFLLSVEKGTTICKILMIKRNFIKIFFFFKACVFD